MLYDSRCGDGAVSCEERAPVFISVTAVRAGGAASAVTATAPLVVGQPGNLLAARPDQPPDGKGGGQQRHKGGFGPAAAAAGDQRMHEDDNAGELAKQDDGQQDQPQQREPVAAEFDLQSGRIPAGVLGDHVDWGGRLEGVKV